jgi:hypothetical protein
MPRTKLSIGGRSLSLDARPDRLDLRDRKFTPQLGSLPPRWPTDDAAKKLLSAYARAKLVRDQLDDGPCTGFGLAAVIDYLFFVGAYRRDGKPPVKSRRSSPAMLYELARLYDEWPGEDYTGSSCRGALKGWHRHGVCRDDLWPYQEQAKKDGGPGTRVFVPPMQDDDDRDNEDRNWDVDALHCTLGVYYRIDSRSIVDMQAAIRQVGAIYCSATIHEGWDVESRKLLNGHEDLAIIEHKPKPKDPGGHAFAITGYNEDGFVVQNSWGSGWASLGFALLPYADWITHGDDAWVFTLGVPGAKFKTPQLSKPAVGSKSKAKGKAKPEQERVRAPRFLVSAADQGERETGGRAIGLVSSSDRVERNASAVRDKGLPPLSAERAQDFTLVLDRGYLVRNNITVPDAAADARQVCLTSPSKWLKSAKSNKLLIYAHGGLNSEAASLARARAVVPYAIASGIYPLFISWRSGSLETVSDIAEEVASKLGLGPSATRLPAVGFWDRVTDKTDRLLEPLLRLPGGALWDQMKINASRASEEGGVRALVGHLAELRAEHPNLEVHLIGHSAGSILLGKMLPLLASQQLTAASLRLFAPACTLDLAVKCYVPAVANQVVPAKHFHIHNLSDRRELEDRVGPYRKSLLYLVSRSFEDVHKMPLLGFDKAFDRATGKPSAKGDDWAEDKHRDVAAWQKAWYGFGFDDRNRKAHIVDTETVSAGACNIRAAHGCFDNAVDIMGDALGYIADVKNPKRVVIPRLDY